MKKIIRNNIIVIVAFFFIAVYASTASAIPVNVMMGDQDFTNGATTNVAGFNTLAADDPSPFNGFIGNDFSSNFSASWTLGFTADLYSSASFTIGIYDHDSGATGNQVASFLIDGFDFTSELNTAFESFGGTQSGSSMANIYTISLTSAVLSQFNDGSAAFSLSLQGPGLQTGNIETTYNGAGIDFVKLSLDTVSVPEPSTLLLLGSGLVGLGFVRRRFKS